MAAALKKLIENLPNLAESADAEWSAACRQLDDAALESSELPSVVQALLHLAQLCDMSGASQRLSSERLWWTVLEKLWRASPTAELARALDSSTIDGIMRVYRSLGPGSRARHHLLRLLATAGTRTALAAFAELVASDPPRKSEDAVLAFVPLFQRPDYPPDALFPRLLDAQDDAAIVTAVLDLANYLTASGLTDRHPAAPRAARLVGLLGGLVGRLARLEEHPAEFAASPADLNAIVSESTGLIVAIVNALALIGEPSVTGKLHQALALGHRRVRTEAAFALARLGDETGIEVLAQMATEPVVRACALAYLDELGKLDCAPEPYRTPAARAEGELAARLALPTYFGAPPQALELVDTSRRLWPGCPEPVDCYLFRYEYRAGERSMSGIGMAGPLAHAFQVDLADLPPDDIYAAYAGWGTEHPEISELEADDLSPIQQAAWQSARQRLVEHDYHSPRLIKLGRFFGEEHFVAAAQWQERPGTAIVCGNQIEWHGHAGTPRSPGETEIYYLFKGRRLLRAFRRDA
ncbi:MAG TPA: HEAT repeat domain-containing protein [Pirellulales bacterium]|nr:HEAT repeat domain-containing protein [Pirellulales bacterium]